jgi:anti-sigma factor RsiW
MVWRSSGVLGHRPSLEALMYAALHSRITPELISDYVAGRLDARDAAMIERIMGRHESVAEAVSAARQVNARMGRFFSGEAHLRRH